MKGALGFLAIAFVIWGFIMTREWLMNPNRAPLFRKRKNKPE